MVGLRFVLACLAAGRVTATLPANTVTSTAISTETLTTTSVTQHRASRKFLFSQTVEFSRFSGTLEQAQEGLSRGFAAIMDLANSRLSTQELEGLPVAVSEVAPPSPPAAGGASEERRLTAPTSQTRRLRARFEVVVTGSAFADQTLSAARVSTPFALLFRDLDPQITMNSVGDTGLTELPEMLTYTTTTEATTTPGPLPVLGGGGSAEDPKTRGTALMFGLLASGFAVFVCTGGAFVVAKKRNAMKKEGSDKNSSDTDVPPVDSIRNDLDFDCDSSSGRGQTLDFDMDATDGGVNVMHELVASSPLSAAPEEIRLDVDADEWEDGTVPSERSGSVALHTLSEKSAQSGEPVEVRLTVISAEQSAPLAMDLQHTDATMFSV